MVDKPTKWVLAEQRKRLKVRLFKEREAEAAHRNTYRGGSEMLKPRITKVNPFAVLVIFFAVWLGCTGRVDWWVIILIGLSHFRIDINLDGL